MELELEIETPDALVKSLEIGLPMKLSDDADLVYKGPVFMKGHVELGQILRFVVHAAENLDGALLAQALYDNLRGTFKQITSITVKTTTVITTIDKDSFQQTITQVIKESRTK